MLTRILNPRPTTNCEGVARRDVLKVGAVGFFGLTLPDFMAMRAAAAVASPRAEAVILLWCAGGPSHLDTFDPKPDAASEFRGEFAAIETSAPGIQVSEHLPLTAKVMHHCAVVRTLTSNIAAHEQASQYLMTGYRPLPTLEYPSYGSVVSRELGLRNHLPPYIAVPSTTRGASSGFIGGAYNAFTVPDPAQQNYRVQDINLPRSVDEIRLAKRRSFAQKLNSRFIEGRPDDSVRSVDSFYEKAYDLIGSSSARKAFDLTEEPSATRELYGMTTYGQGALLARRLVEAGTRFVTVTEGGWDTHQNNFRVLKDQRLPRLDRAFAGLISDLDQRGLLDKTLVILMGEFGRTPRVNPRGGRDHYSRCRFVTLAGAGIRGGQAIGKSDETGSTPAERPVSVEDLATTLYSALGIDYHKQYVTPTGRPIHIATGGEPIKELWG